MKSYKKTTIIMIGTILCLVYISKPISNGGYELIEGVRTDVHNEESYEKTMEHIQLSASKKSNAEDKYVKKIGEKSNVDDENVEIKTINQKEKIEVNKANIENSNKEDSHEDISLSDKINKELGGKQGTYYVGIKDLRSNDRITIGSENKAIPSASVIKVYIMVEYFNQINQGIINNSEEQLILVEKMIQNSDNEATNELIDLLLMENINKTLEKIGCTGTKLERKMLDFQSRLERKDNYTSVADTMMILEKIYNGNCVSQEMDKIMIDIMKGQNRRNKIPNKLPKDIEVCNKTGELPIDNANGFFGVENDVAIINGKSSSYIICVFASDLNNCSNAINAIQDISKITFEHMESGKGIHEAE